MIYLRGCFKTQIIDEEREFVSQVSDASLELTCTDQRVTSAYNQRSNRLCEWRTELFYFNISLVKVLKENPTK